MIHGGVIQESVRSAKIYECQAQITLTRALSKSENADRTEDVKAARVGSRKT